MSPIGRTFIVLNLIAAGAFVGVASSYIQRQHHWKTEYTNLSTEFDTAKAEWSTERDRLDSDLKESGSSARAFEQQLDAKKNELSKANDDIKRLREQNADLQASFAGLQGTTDAINKTLAQAWDEAKEASRTALSAVADKDAAIRDKDAAEAENRSLKNTIADMTSTIENKDMQLAKVGQTNSELELLVDAARAKGFIDRMAVPVLDGTVSMVTGNLVTLSITNNPTEAEIKPGTRFAIYDPTTSVYKGEVRVTSVDASRNAAFCTFEIKKGNVVAGDRASTHTAGVAGL
jgi:hypothetical protein